MRYAHTTNILFRSAAMLIGKTVFKILKVLIRLIARSTCTLTEEMRLVYVSSSIVKHPLSLRNGGIFSCAYSGKSCSMEKPFSAITESPGSSGSNIPQVLVTALSLQHPGNKSDTNVTEPDGAIPISPLAVL